MVTLAMTVDLNNKTTLVTGASSGIGAAVAEARLLWGAFVQLSQLGCLPDLCRCVGTFRAFRGSWLPRELC